MAVLAALAVTAIPSDDPGFALLVRAGQLELARADLVAAMDPDLVAASEVDAGSGVTYHFVVAAAASRLHW